MSARFGIREAPAKEVGRLQQLWNSPVGPKTVHFWAPIMKVGYDMTFHGSRRSGHGDYSKIIHAGTPQKDRNNKYKKINH
jgi:hypothetical protein